MKNVLTLLFLSLGVTLGSAQKIYDFESQQTSLFFQYFGSSLEPQLTTVVPNPGPDAQNNSGNVGRYIKAAGAQVWAGGFANPAPASPVVASSGTSVCIKVWMDHPGNVALKLEAPVGGGENWITTQPYTTPNMWQELCFSVDVPSLEDSKLPAAGKTFSQVVLFFDFGTPGGSADETYFFDDITFPEQITTTVILDFEAAETTTDFSYFGSNLDGQKTTVINNPNASGLNTSAKVLKYTKPAVAEVWAGAYSNPDPQKVMDVTGSAKICIKVHMDHIGNLALKLEGAQDGKPNWIQKVSNTKINEWEEICFDATLPSLEAPFEKASSIFTRAVLFFDFGIPGTGTDVTSYADDLVVKKGGSAAVRKVGFKVNMNNYTGNFDKVYLSGSFNSWSGDANPLKDEDLDGIWEGELMLPNGLYEYKVTLDNWAAQEQFTGKEECTKTTDIFVNRLLPVSADAVLPEFCYNSCYACGEQVNITFRLGMGNVDPNPEGVWLAGGGNFDVPGGKYRMTDDNNDKVYEVVVPRKKGFTSYFTFTNGPCADYSCKENIEGQPCASPENFNDRKISNVSDNLVYESCFGLCATNVACTSRTNDASSKEGMFRIVNNPVINQQLHITFSENVSMPRKVVVADGFGRVILQQIIAGNISDTQIQLLQVPSGVYTVWISAGKWSQAERFIMP
jgi:hypothetical protein